MQLCFDTPVKISGSATGPRGREVVKDLKLDLDYDTAEQAERAGLVFSKKWVDAGKP
jgi:hypothetical protein